MQRGGEEEQQPGAALRFPPPGHGGVGTAVHGTGVVEGTDRANRVGGRAPGGDVTETPAALALLVPMGGVCMLDRA